MLSATKSHQAKSPVRLALHDFGPSVKKVYPYMVGGILIGSLCFLAGRLVVPLLGLAPTVWLRDIAPEAAKLMHHLGVGFFVSATAVLLYEWGAHYKEVVENGHRLTRAVDRILVSTSKDALRESLMQMFGRFDADGRRLSNDIVTFCASIESLYRHHNWSTAAYIHFVQVLVTDLSKNTKNLSDLNACLSMGDRQNQNSSELYENSALMRPYELALSKGGALADAVLAREMRELQPGDEYLVVSDIDSWTVLQTFGDAQKAAVDQGVRIRRIFVLDDPPSRDAAPILNKHFTDADAWTQESRKNGAYAVRVLTNVEFQRLAPSLARLRHFGVFRPTAPRSLAVRFEVTEPDLSKFSLVPVPHDDASIDAFEGLWPRVADLTGEKRVEFLLKLEMKYLERGGRYHVASDFHSWLNDGLAGFHEETLKAIASRDITVRRVFVLRDGETGTDACREILRRHYSETRLGSDHRRGYEIKLCLEAEARRLDALGEQWHFGVFRSGGLEGDELRAILSELPGRDMSEFILSPLRSQERAERLEKFVQGLEPVETSARRLLGIDL
ncbi:MAG: hypothetical protein ACXW5U_04075 [Thermoanaerobaculia bacterium]